MTSEEINACWRDPQNRKCGLYYCKADPRVIVPKFPKWMGWTINFARSSAVPVMLGLLALLALPFAMVILSGGGFVLSYVTLAGSIIAMCLLCAYFSSSKRWE